MELGKRLKELRSERGLTQEALSERLYVSRQTLSSWENDKTYPDIHSLILLSEVFEVSLDTLIKGDIEVMKEQVNSADIRSFRRNSNIFAALVFATLLAPIPLLKWFGIPGLIVLIPIAALMLYYSYKVAKIKKIHDIHTYREIVAFTRGEKLDGIEKAREEGKRYYQKIALALASAAVGALVAMILSKLIHF